MPNNFSFIENPEEMIDCFAKAIDRARLGILIFFDLGKVRVTSDGAAFLMSSLRSAKLLNKEVAGNLPEDESSRQLLYQSGFFDVVSSRSPVPAPTNSIVFTQLKADIAPKIAAEVRKFATQGTFGKDVQYAPLYSLVTDLMQNTFDHAALDNPVKRENWLLHVFFDESTKVSHFTFVDRGMGIIRTMKNSRRNDYRRWKRTLQTDQGILNDILRGYERSRTDDPQRGYGLPDMYQRFLGNNFSRLVVISNGAFIDFQKGICRKLRRKFEGTFIYWELTPNNHVHPANHQVLDK